MEHVSAILNKHTIVVLNEALKGGFTQIPNYVLRDVKISFGARLALAMLLSYAWQKDSCFPGQERLANDLGVTSRAIRTYLCELRDRGYVEWKQQGLNKTNIYYILDFHPRLLHSKAERKERSGQGRKAGSIHRRKESSDK